jgi:hypothetical protein
MNRFGLSAAQWRAVTATLCSSHRLRVRAQLLDLDGKHLASLTPQLLDGQVDLDVSAEVVRRATVVIDDRRRALPFDSDSPSPGAFWFDRMIRVAYDVLTDAYGWLTLVPFTGPVVGLARDGRQVTVTCDGMERLAMGNTWTVLALDKGMRKTDAIRRIMRELVGESRFDIPDLPATLPRPVTLTPDDVPWVQARRIAHSMDRQLFYTGGGVLTLRRHPEHVAFEFTGRRHVLSSPQVSAPSDFANAARVVGHDPKGPKRQLVAQAVASGPLSPSRLGHNGVPRYLMAGGATVQADNAKTRAEVNARASRELVDALRQPVQVSFDALPGPGAFLDPGDKCRVSVDEGAVTFRLTQLSMPLNTANGQGMSVGYNDYRMGHGRPRVRVHRRPPAGADTTAAAETLRRPTGRRRVDAAAATVGPGAGGVHRERGRR